MIPYPDLGSLETLQRGDDLFARWEKDRDEMSRAIRTRDRTRMMGPDSILSYDPACHWEVGNSTGLAQSETRAICRSHACPMCRCLHRFLPRHGRLNAPFRLRAGPHAGTEVQVSGFDSIPSIKPWPIPVKSGSGFIGSEYWGMDPMLNSLIITWELSEIVTEVGTPRTIPQLYTGFVCRNRSYTFGETLAWDLEETLNDDELAAIARGCLIQLVYFLELMAPYGFLHGTPHVDSFGILEIPFGLRRYGDQLLSAPRTLQIGNFEMSTLTILDSDSDKTLRVGPKIRNADRYLDPRRKICPSSPLIRVTPEVMSLCTNSHLPAVGSCLSICQALNAYQLLMSLYQLPRIGPALQSDSVGSQVWSTMWQHSDPNPAQLLHATISTTILSDIEPIVFSKDVSTSISRKRISPIQLTN